MRYELLSPILMIILSLIASIVYGLVGDIRRCVYWVAVAIINLVITF